MTNSIMIYACNFSYLKWPVSSLIFINVLNDWFFEFIFVTQIKFLNYENTMVEKISICSYAIFNCFYGCFFMGK